ncbi:hypothetical protein D9615_001824 [Tricholomella constricta]|uniref:Uncharacterized protein n=1 Tax=Tricholomella constricta TaxID=117010 RepID=A0A8H5HNS0_9AGAR|nr:hypothetical protein D9615_001824 [Tricholomella constricta]
MIKFGSLALPARRCFSTCNVTCAGHNKWSKIKQKKGANDAQKGVVFGKAARDIVMAARSTTAYGGSPDPTKNLQLAAVLKRAKEMDVPKENIEKALAKASQGKDHNANTFVYEALAFNTVGLIIECATDNNNRTIHNLREILNDYGARAAPVKFMFRRVGYVTAHQTTNHELETKENAINELVGTAMDHGAVDFDNMNSEDAAPAYWFTCEPDRLHPLSSAIQEHHQTWTIGTSEFRYVPLEDSSEPSDETKADLRALIDELEANEDVVQVWSSLQDDVD